MATLETMYPGMPNSPVTELSAAITDTDTTFAVNNGAVLPPAPNLASIGQGDTSETVRYGGKTGNTLSDVERGVDGTVAASWGLGAKVARLFTELDYAALRANINEINAEVEMVGTDVIGVAGVLTAATSVATPDTLVKRDADGRFKSAAPAASDDVARKADVDAVSSNLPFPWVGPTGQGKGGIYTGNLNELLDGGLYGLDGMATNAPVVTTAAVVEVLKRSSGHIIQRFTDRVTLLVYHRQSANVGVSWGAWTKSTRAEVSSSAPSSPVNGDIWYDSTEHKFKGRADGAWV